MRRLTENDQLTDWLSEQYPSEITIEDGTRLTVTPMVPSDWRMLEQFLQAMSDGERKFFRRDATDPARVERWCSELDYRHVLPLLAWDADRIVADGVLEREPGLWTSHVGKLRLLVHPEYRHRRIGLRMVQELIRAACDLNLHKLTYECAADQMDLVAFLHRAGFHEAANLPEFIRDRQGRLHDMVLMVLNLA